MYNRRILINEDDRSRILGMHQNHAKRFNLNFGRLNEAASKPATEVLTTKDDIIAFQDWVVNTKKQNLGRKNPLGKGLGVDGLMNAGGPTEVAWNSGLGDEYMKTKGMLGSGIENMSFNVNGTKMNYASDEELKSAVQGGQVTMDTQVWYQGIPTGTWTAISALPAEEQTKFKVVSDTAATISPDVSQAKEFTLSQTGSGAGQKMSLSAIDAAIKAGTINNTWFYVNANNQYESITKNTELKALLDAAAGPQSATTQGTGNEAVDQWLASGLGQAWKQLDAEGKGEKYLDFLERQGNIPPVEGGKDAFRQLIGTKADNKLAGLQRKVKKGIEAYRKA